MAVCGTVTSTPTAPRTGPRFIKPGSALSSLSYGLGGLMLMTSTEATWLHVGVPSSEVARRLGHRFEIRVPTYIGALQEDEQVATDRIQAVPSESRAASERSRS